MKLHKLRLENFRGVVEREVEFPDTGVVIIQGPNEIGKTSMMDALDFLLSDKDSSKKGPIRSAQPVGRDVPVMVSAEISAGPYRFHYKKQWLRSPATELRITAPRAESLTGAEAHDRVVEILRENVDLDLFEALRVLQGQPVNDQVDLQGNAALRAALESASGTAISEDEDIESLVQTIEAEYLKYFTRAGRPRGDFLASETEVEEASAAVTQAEASLAEIDSHVERYERLEGELSGLGEQEQGAKETLQEQQERFDALEKHRTAVARARAEYESANQRLEAAQKTFDEREALRAARDERDADAKQKKELLTQAEEQEKTAAEALSAHLEKLKEAEEAYKAGRERVSVLEKEVTRAQNAIEYERETERIKQIESANERLETAERVLAQNRVDDEKLEAIRTADINVQVARAGAVDAAAQLVVSVREPEEITVDEEPVSVEPHADMHVAVTKPVFLGVGSNVSIQITPARGDEESAQGLLAAEESHAQLLADAGVTDLQEAVEVNAKHRQSTQDKKNAQDDLKRALGTDTLAAIQARLAVLKEDLDVAANESTSVEEAQERLDTERAALVELEVVVTDEREARTELEAQLNKERLALATARSKSEAAHTELARAQTQFESAENQVPAAAVHSELEEAGKAAGAAAEVLRSLEEELEKHDPDTAAELLRNAKSAVDRIASSRIALQDELSKLKGALETIGSQGRQEDLDAARTKLAGAEEKFERITRQANAARLLHETVQRHQQETWQKYVAPFQERITALGRLVFGSDVSFEVSAKLEIISRTRGQNTVPFAGLSTGAQEQVGILSRLACAQLVSDGGGVPVLIDDALGNSDPKRLEGLGAVLSRAGRDAQVIVLTCTPDRYRDVGDATVVRL